MINVFTRDARGNLIRSIQHGFHLFNTRGDVVQRVNSQGVVLHTYRYDAFGNEISPDSGNTNRFRFAGEYFDWETGTIYLRARSYNPRTGRFTQPDPHWNIGNAIFGDNLMERNGRFVPCPLAIMQAGNLFVYCINNPIRWTDPTGRIIELAGTRRRREEILEYLQQLTNDELGLDGRRVIIVTRNDIEGRETGTELIRRLIENEDHTVTIRRSRGGNTFQASNTSASMDGRGSGGTVRFNPNQNLRRTHISELQNHMYIALGHELIHAERAMRGAMAHPLLINGRYTITTYIPGGGFLGGYRTHHFRAPYEELFTIGIPFWSDHFQRNFGVEPITENSLREEHGIRARIRWSP